MKRELRTGFVAGCNGGFNALWSGKNRFLGTVLLFLMVMVNGGMRGQTILVDDFNRTDSNTVGNGWTETETVASGAQIASNILQLGSTTAGRDWVYKDLSALTNPITTNGITNNTSTITWAFNFRTNRSNPSGFDTGNYGIAFILCKSTTSLTTGDGYAVTIGGSTSNDPIKLTRFTGGVDANADFTDIIVASTSGGVGNNTFVSVRVTYNPVNDEWALFAEANASSFPQADPRNTTTQIGSNTVSTTYTTTGNNLRYFGCLWNHSTGAVASNNGIFDDIYAPNIVTPSIAITAAHPTASNVLQGSTDNIIGGVALAVTTADATLTGITFTTAGGYTATDIATNGFKIWLSSSATSLSGAAQLGTAQAAVASGGSVAVSSLSSTITSGTTRYVLLTANIANGATINNKIRLASTAFSNITFSSGTKTGTDPVAAGASPTNDQTIIGPAIAFSNNGTQVAAGNVTQGTTKHLLSSFKIDVATANTTLTYASFITGGNYQSSDASSFKLWYKATNDLSTATQIGTTQASTSSGSGEIITFSSLSQTINTGATGYFWITTDIEIAGTVGRTINIDFINSTDFVFSTGVKSGTPTAAGTQTITATSTPTLTADTLAAFGSQCINLSYGPNSFTITGAALTSANVTVSSLSGYTFSTTSGGTYTTSLSLAQSGGAYSQQIFVLFNPTVASSYDGNIVIGGGGASNINVAASGTGTFTASVVTSAVATSVTAQAATLQGNVTNVGCPSIIEKGFVYSLTATDATPTVGEGGVTKTIVAGTSTGNYTLALSSLPASTGYSFNSYVYNGSTYFYGTVRQFTTSDALVLTGTLAHGSVCPTVAASPQSYTITNNSNATVTGISVGSNNAEFVVSGLSSTSITAGGTATYSVTFTPATAGAKNATISVTSADAATVTNTVTGTGITIVSPSSTTLAATAITNNGATLQAGAPTFGVCPATTAKGFVISETSVNNNPLFGGSGVTNESVTLGTAVAYNKAISGLTPGVNYTYKSYLYDGTTYTYGATQNFTVLLPADHLTFVSVPATGTVSTNLTSFTVEARRPDNSVDTYYTGTITIAKASGPGVLSGTLSTAAVAGVATFSTAQFDAAGTYTISTSSGSLAGATSGNIVISLVPGIIYQHNFGTTSITGHPYNVSPTATPVPGILNSNLSNSSWTNNGSTTWSSFGGSSGQALALSSISTNNVWTLTFDVTNGYKVDISSFSFWRQSSAATNNWSMTINGIAVGSGTIPSNGTTGTINVSNTVANLTGTVTVVLTYGGALSGSMRIDDFTLNGFVTLACTPPTDPVGTISGTTPACTSTVLTYAGADSANAYWQSTATGTSMTEPVSSTTKTVSASGTHYIRIYSGSCWSLNSISQAVTINTLPATAGTPSPANASTGICYSGSSPVTSVSWTAVPGATSYDVYFGAGSMPGSVTANVTSASYTTGTLLASTTYHWKVVAKNACGDTAGVVTNWSFTTASGFCYCTPTGSLDCASWNDYISNVTLNTLNYTSTCGTGGYTIVPPTGAQTTILTQGTSYTFSITGGLGTGAHGAGVYFDWNQDGDFIDPLEFVLISNNVQANATATATVTVPAGATLGSTRMRVRYAYEQTPAFSNSCTISGVEGETEDYTISVIAACTPAANPVGTIAGTTPACTSTTLTYVAADSANAYWQSTATGISFTEPVSSTTKTVSTSGTHYIRIYDGSCWSTNSISYAVVINTATAITAHPASAYAVVGNTATFNVTATGTGLSYQWQEKIGAGSWTNVGTNSSSYTTPNTILAMDGRLYQVIISGTCGNVTSGSALLTVGTVSLCNPIWEENFDFGCADATDIMSLSQFTTNWGFYSDGTDPLKYSAVGLSYTGYISSGVGGSAQYQSGGDDDLQREIKYADNTYPSPGNANNPDNNLFVSFLVNMTALGTADYFVTLKDGSNTLYCRVNARSSGSGYQIGITKSAATVQWSSVLTYGTTYLIVLKNEFVSGTVNDVLKLWVIESGVPASEALAGTATLQATTGDTDPSPGTGASIRYLAIRQTGKESGFIDGIRVGTTWSDVLCNGVPASKNYTWTGGAGSSLWTAASNWSPAGVPGSIDNVIIDTAPASLLNITDCRKVKDFTINGTGNFNMSSTGSLTITGNVTYGGTATATLDCDSYVYITSSSPQTIPALNYGNLDALGGNRTFPSGKTIGICSGFNVNPNLHTYTVTGSTVNYFSPDTGWGMFPFTYHNLTFSGAGSFSFGGGWSSYSGTKVVNVLGKFTQTNGTINLVTNGYDFSNSATINISGSMEVTGGTFNMKQGTDSSIGTVNLQGNLVVGSAGTLTATGGVTSTDFNFTGTANQTVSGTGTINMYRGTINKASGYVDLQRSLEIKRVLTMTSGNIATNANTLTLGESTTNTGTLVRTAGYVIGKMTRWFATGATTGNNGLFPLGNSGDQSRFASINYANVTTGGRLTAEIVNTAMGSIGTITVPAVGSCIAFDPITGESFYWTLTPTGIVGTTYTASFTNETFTDTPLCNLALLNRNPTSWASTGTHIATTGTTTNYIVSRSGLTGYGDFGIGRKGNCGSTKTWAAGAWTGGDGLAPTMTDAVIFAGDYDTVTTTALPNISSCECTVNPGVTVTIDSGKTLSIEYGLTISDNVTPTDLTDDGKLIIADGGSLIQVVNPTVDGTGNSTKNNIGSIKMHRNTKPMYRYDFTYWSSPVAGTTLHDLSPITLFDKYFKWNHSASTQAWQAIINGTESMVAGRGYIVRAPQNYPIEGSSGAPTPIAYPGLFTGRPNNGIVTHPVTGGTDKWNLLGNPYPSAIDADLFLDANIDDASNPTSNKILGGTLYFWTHNTDIVPVSTGSQIYTYNSGDYASWNGTGGTDTKEAATDPTPADPNDNLPLGFIAAGQSFFVQGTVSGNAIFNNGMRVAGNNTQFFRPAPTEPQNNWSMTGKHRVWLNMKGQNKGFSQTLVGYIENATNDLDNRFDGESFGGNQVTFYSLIDNKKLVIQGRALPFNNQDEVPLGYKSTLNGTLSISIDHYDGLFEGQGVYLEDKLLNIVHDLKESAYSFTSTVGTFNERFVLRYLPSEELSNPGHEAIANGLIVYQEHNTIMLKSQLEDMSAITVYDLLGRIVYDEKNIGKREFGIQNVVMNEQPLIIKVRLANGQVVNRKVVY